MMNRNKTLLTLAIVAMSSLFLANSANAAPIFATATNGPNSPSTTTDELAYAGDVSSSDLLHGLVGVPGGTGFGANGSSPHGLNDALNGGDYEADGLPALVGAAWPGTGSTIEFDLGVGTGDGYDITEIQSISAWQDLGLTNQNYDVLVKYLGDAGFTQLTTVTYQPFTAGGGATKVNVTDSTGVLASGIEAIRFNFLATAGHNAGSVYHEIDVFGAVTDNDPERPDVDAGFDMITWSGQGVLLAPTVVNNSDPVTDLTYFWSADPATGVAFDPNEFVQAPTVTITKATNNPSVVTLTLAVNNVGSGKADVTDTMDIYVYDNACLAAEVTTYEFGDYNKDCIINLKDFSILASKWLGNYTLIGPVAK
jgi:hypothetical protein